jgi:hypothetical protein
LNFSGTSAFQDHQAMSNSQSLAFNDLFSKYWSVILEINDPCADFDFSGKLEKSKRGYGNTLPKLKKLLAQYKFDDLA